MYVCQLYSATIEDTSSTQPPSERVTAQTAESATTQSVTISTPPQTDSSFLTPMDTTFEDISSGSGESSGDMTDFTTAVTMEMTFEPTTTDPLTTQPNTPPTTNVPTTQPTEPSTTDAPDVSNFERWFASSMEWENSFTSWVATSREGSNLRLPTGVDVGEVIEEIGDDDRMNRGVWSRLLEHWRNNFVVYEEAYGGVCPEQV